MAGYGVALGAVDATTNMQAVAVERRYRRTILPSFHGAWTFGGLIGAGVALAMGSLPLSDDRRGGRAPPRRPRSPRTCGGRSRRSGGRRCGAVAADRPGRARDGALLHGRHGRPDLGTAVPRPGLDAPSKLVALAVFPYLLASGAIRLAGDNLVARYGAVRVLRVGAVVASSAW